MESRDLILLNEEESKIAIDKGLRNELDIFIIDIAKNIPHLLSIGAIDEIRQATPERTIITLESPPTGVTIGRYAKVGHLDLRILQLKYNEIFNKKPKDSIGCEKNISETERNSLYKMILGMAMKKYNYNPKGNRNSATGANSGSIQADLEEYGLSLDEETIRSYLQNAFKMHKEQISITE